MKNIANKYLRNIATMSALLLAMGLSGSAAYARGATTAIWVTSASCYVYNDGWSNPIEVDVEGGYACPAGDTPTVVDPSTVGTPVGSPYTIQTGPNPYTGAGTWGGTDKINMGSAFILPFTYTSYIDLICTGPVIAPDMSATTSVTVTVTKNNGGYVCTAAFLSTGS